VSFAIISLCVASQQVVVVVVVVVVIIICYLSRLLFSAVFY
jgi:hypothetical protein